MNMRHLGPLAVSAVGLGCMAMSGVYGAADEDESIATIHAAIGHGITLLDTGDFYGMGHNEMLIRRALEQMKGSRDKVVLSVKFGAMRGPDASWIGVDTRPAAIRNFCAYSLQRLGTDHIDIYRPARLDPNVPIEETVGAIADLVKAGYVRYIGLSEVGTETIRRAQAVHPICDLQIEYAMVTREPEKSILPTLRELGIGMTAYGVLSRGLLSGSQPKHTGDFRAHLPRFTGENLKRNRQLVDVLTTVAEQRDLSLTQLAIAWVLGQGEDIVPLIGARTRKQLNESLGAVEKPVPDDTLAAADRALEGYQVAGTRYDERQMQMLDSEKG